MDKNAKDSLQETLLEYFRKGFVSEEEREYKERMKRTEEGLFGSNERRGEEEKGR